MSLVAAVARNGVIGNAGVLPWHLPEDLRHFKRVTLGRPVIMGRRTWESLPARFRPLPGRRNIVVTRDRAWHSPGAEALPSLDAALVALQGVREAAVIGGAQLFAEALPLVDELLLTEIERDVAGDTRLPAWPRDRFTEVARECHRAVPPNDFDYCFVTYHRMP